MPQTISNALAWWSRMRSEQPALVLEDDVLTFSALHAWSDRIAAFLIADGLKPGDRVGICSTNTLAYGALIMGTIRAGGICSPISFRYTSREIRDITDSSQPRFVFTVPEYQDKMREAGLDVRGMAQILKLREGERAQISNELHPDDSVVIIATSGSTAKPKGVVYTNRSMTAYAAGWAAEQTDCSTGARAIIFAPLSTSAGFVQFIFHATLGYTSYMVNQFVAEEALSLLVRERINLFAAVPVFFEAIARCSEFGDADLSSIVLATVGGARVEQPLQEAYLRKGITLRQIYGQTEIGGNATMMPAHLAAIAPEKCGWGGLFMDIAVVRPDGSRSAPGESGEIVMRSPGMMKEYWRNPEETAKTIRNGWLHSGDIGLADEDGLITFIDRFKDLIISGGLNISAAEIEYVVAAFPGVVEVVAIAAPDPKFNETPMVVYHGPAEVDVAALITHCGIQLSDYKVPRYVAYSKEPLPRLASGKLSKPEVRARYAEAHKTLPKVR